MNAFDSQLATHGLTLTRAKTEVLQINTGKLCNLTCSHCHVNAGPQRKEIITRETIERIVEWLQATTIPTVDLTGGAPEMIPDFCYLIEKIRALPLKRRIINRSNLTILLEPGYTHLPQFLASHQVEVIASLPCYTPQNVDLQRGDGVFSASIRALQILNQLGYGINPTLPLHLVYNPVGDELPGPQSELEKDYKQALLRDFGLRFNSLFTITNMPIARFASQLRASGQLETYYHKLAASFNPAAVGGLMCRNTLNIDWLGRVYDCDFNQMLDLAWKEPASPSKSLYLWELKEGRDQARPILTGRHCLVCTAGSGSSCGGALVKSL